MSRPEVTVYKFLLAWVLVLCLALIIAIVVGLLRHRPSSGLTRLDDGPVIDLALGGWCSPEWPRGRLTCLE